MNDSPVDCQSRDLTEPAGETLARRATPFETEGLLVVAKLLLQCDNPSAPSGHLPLHRGGPRAIGNRPYGVCASAPQQHNADYVAFRLRLRLIASRGRRLCNKKAGSAGFKVNIYIYIKIKQAAQNEVRFKRAA